MFYSISGYLLSFLESSLSIPLSWGDTWPTGVTWPSRVELLQHFQTRKGHEVMAGPEFRVKEVVEVRAGHIQVESTRPFKLLLSELCRRGKAGRQGPGSLENTLQGTSWVWAGSQRPVLLCKVVLRGCHRHISVKWQVLDDSTAAWSLE